MPRTPSSTDVPPEPPGEGNGEGPRRSEAALGFGPPQAGLEDTAGSAEGRQMMGRQHGRPRRAGAGGCRDSHPRQRRFCGPDCPPPSHPPLSSLVQLRPRDSVRIQRPPHGPPKRGGDAASYRRSGRHATRRRLGYAGRFRSERRRGSPLGTATAGGRAASGAVTPPPLPQGSAPEPAVSARGLGGRGGGAERRALTGVCAPNGTSDTPGCAKTDLPPSLWQQRGGPSAFFFFTGF